MERILLRGPAGRAVIRCEITYRPSRRTTGIKQPILEEGPAVQGVSLVRVALRKQRRLQETIDPPNDPKTSSAVIRSVTHSEESATTGWA